MELSLEWGVRCGLSISVFSGVAPKLAMSDCVACTMVDYGLLVTDSDADCKRTIEDVKVGLR